MCVTRVLLALGGGEWGPRDGAAAESDCETSVSFVATQNNPSLCLSSKRVAVSHERRASEERVLQVTSRPPGACREGLCGGLAAEAALTQIYILPFGFSGGECFPE